MDDGSEKVNEVNIIRKESSNPLIPLLLVALVLGGVYYFTRSQDQAGNNVAGTETTREQVQEQPVVTPPVEEQKEPTTPTDQKVAQTEMKFTVNGANFSFEPKTIKVKEGDKVSIEFKNMEGTHNFLLDEFNIATKTLNEGQSETVTFTADQKGEFEYYCSVGQHRVMGMVGTLVVE